MKFTRLTNRGAEMRVWAPDRSSVAVVIDGTDYPLRRDRHGYFSACVERAVAGARYRLRLDDEAETYPDPASQYQPDGPHGDSMVVDASAYEWHDDSWRGPDLRDLVIYEMHVGTFTREGTWRSAIPHLKALREIGITMIEMMPVHEFPGAFGWGYDGVGLWAPSHLYGTPDDLRAFVDAAHAADLSVILDVVYNHFGPDGCYLRKFTDKYFTDRYVNDWGDSLNFDGNGCDGVREFFIENAGYWIEDFRFDGLRLDATQSLNDSSPRNIMADITQRVREVARGRTKFVVGENEPQDMRLIREFKLDALWNDDWHHAAHVAATGRREAYYTDYGGRAQEFVSMARHGFLFQGQLYTWQDGRRGTMSRGTDPNRFVCYLDNHDQVANSARGERIHQITSPGRYRTLTALLILGPNIPMLFQGQEFAANTPFLYFADHKKELAEAITRGRREFMDQFRSIATSDIVLARPDDPATFEASKLDDTERASHTEALDLHRELLALRRELRGPADGAVLGDEAFVLRFANDFILIVNLGPQLTLEIMPEPLLAPPPGMEWRQRWSSEGVPLVTTPAWVVPAEAAVLLQAAPEPPSAPRPRRRASDAPGRRGPSPATEPPSASTSSSDRTDGPK